MICNGPSLDPFVERVRRAVLIADIVESVRLIEADEEGIITRWLNLVRQIENELMPANQGHLVKSLGDGLLLEFTDARTAVLAAFAIQRASERDNAGKPDDRLMLLRIGIEIGDVLIEQHDVFGHGVNLAARLTNLAGPGEIVVSATVREQITPDLDADVEDMGECFLKHVREPVRAYRVRPPGMKPPPRLAPAPVSLLPTLAVIPFAERAVSKEHEVLGEVLAEELIRDFSRSSDLNVISRLSTTAFRSRVVSLGEIREHLNANYVLSGKYRVDGDRIRLDCELADAKSSGILWSERVEDGIGGIISGDGELMGRVTKGVKSAVVAREVERARLQTLPNLESYSLLLGAIALMHRLSKHDFEHAHRLLDTLIEREPRQPVPRAWLAKWHVLRVQQGWTDDPDEEAKRALDNTKRALDADPHCSPALTVDGFVHTNLLKRLDIAADRYNLAIETNPNDSLAWLLKGTMHAFRGEGDDAVAGVDRALMLSPFDPLRYFYDSLAATAQLAAGDYEQAVELAARSLKANKAHTSTFRALAIAQWQLGRHDEARETVRSLVTLEPNLTVSTYLERSPAADYSTGQEWSKALKSAGLPD